MTQVYLEQNGRRFTVSSQGHATGSPEVCAAASCLIYTLAGWLHNSAVLVLEERLNNDASAFLCFRGGDSAETAFDMVCVGFLQLAQEYPEYISVNFQVI